MVDLLGRLKGEGDEPQKEKGISESEQVEEKIHQQQEELEIILDSVPAMVFYKDKENRFIRVNETLAQAFGMSKEDIVGKTAAELSPGKDYWEDDKKVMETGNPLRNIIEPIETSEGTRWVKTDKIPYLDLNGNIIGIIGFAVDITDLKQYEGELKKKLEDLEKFHKLAVGREQKMIELKARIKELEEELGKNK